MSQSYVGAPVSSDLRVYYADDPDPQKAGQGLALAPRINEVIGQQDLNYWMMSPAEQMAMVYLLEHTRPRVAIEVGTRFGGSLQVLSKYCGRVYSLDIDPEVPKRLAGKYQNVEYIIGPSTETLPALMKRLTEEKAEVGFILVDGDHSAAGVKADIDNALQYKPIVPLYIIMHDSFNPECRQGLAEARWTDNPHVHAVELDFVPGAVNPSPYFLNEAWGGLALGILLPEPRQGRFQVVGRGERTFRMAQGPHQRAVFMGRLRRWLRRKMKR
jgi:Cephalosporin hydroxylase